MQQFVSVVRRRRRKLTCSTVLDDDITGRIHRLTLSLSRRGDVRSVYCVPCGPLLACDPLLETQLCDQSTDGQTQPTSSDQENHYTRVSITSPSHRVKINVLPSQSIGIGFKSWTRPVTCFLRIDKLMVYIYDHFLLRFFCLHFSIFISHSLFVSYSFLPECELLK